jgi:molybdate transport system substrate-binding protein
MPIRRFPALAAAVALLLAAASTHADEVRVLAAGAAKHAVETIAPGFERATGHALRASYDTVGAQRDRVLQAPPGAAADVVVLSDAALEQLRGAGRLAAASALPLGRVSVSLAVAAGRPLPALADAAQLRQALLDAPSIAYADPARGATAGTHFARTLDALGIREAVAARTTVLPFGVDVIEAVAQGRYALGVSQSSEISNHPGVRLAGPLPPPHAQGTGYAAALASDSIAARALMDYLRSGPATQALRDSGFSEAAAR